MMMYRPSENSRVPLMAQVEDTRDNGVRGYGMALNKPHTTRAQNRSWSAAPIIDYDSWKAGMGKPTGPTSSLPQQRTPGAGYAEANWAQNGGRGSYG